MAISRGFVGDDDIAPIDPDYIRTEYSYLHTIVEAAAQPIPTLDGVLKNGREGWHICPCMQLQGRRGEEAEFQ